MLLLPAAFLILIMMAGITVDYSIAFLGKRELANLAQAAANDAASGVALDAYHRDVVVIDAELAEARARAALANRDNSSRWLRITNLQVRPSGDTVVVTVSATTNTLFSRTIPGARDRIHLRVRATADAVRG